MVSRVRRDPPAEEQAELTIAVGALREEVRVLREVLDEIRAALQWQNNNAGEFPELLEQRAATCSLASATLPPPAAAADPRPATSPVPRQVPTQQQKLF